MKKKGFTLTEMVAAIVILALIIALAVTAYRGIKVGLLRKDYENLVSYLETKAANYSEDTGELNVTVERLIETGYIEPDEANKLLSPVDKSSMNCYMFDSVYTNGNYQAKMADNIGEDTNGKCNTYHVNKEIQICVQINSNECITEFKDWYKDNVILGVKIGGNTEYASKASIVWKVNGVSFVQDTYETNISTINKGLYTVDVKYDIEDPESEGVKKHFEGSDTVAINIDREKPAVTKAVVENDDAWVNTDREIDVSFTDYSGSGVNKLIVYEVTSNDQPCPDLTNEGWINVSSTTYSVTKKAGQYRVCVIDNANNISNPYPIYDEDDPDSGSIDIHNIDQVSPTCIITVDSGTKGENNWYITYPTLKMTYEDDDGGSGVSYYSLRNKNEVYYGNESTYEQKTDVKTQNYYGFVRDKAGNTGTCVLENIKVDTTKPGLKDISKSTNSWTNVDITLTTTATDSTSQMGAYSVTTTNSTPTKWTTIKGAPASYNVSYKAATNGTYYIWVKDMAGNVTSKSITISNVDKTLPKVTTPTASPTTWTNKDVTITTTVSDNESKLSGYAVTTTDSTPTNWTTINGSPASYNVSYKATANGTYYIWVKDVAGNVAKSSIKITNIDKTNPAVNTPSYTPTAWTNGDVTIKALISDNESKLASYAVTTSTSTPTNWTTISGGQASYTINYTAKTNGTYYVWAKDIAGNINKNSIKITNIDKVNPTIGAPSISPTGWTNGNVTITSAVSDNDSKLAGYAVTTNTTTPTSWTSISGSQANYTVTYTATANNTYYVWVKDTAGNINKNSIKVTNIDKTIPGVGAPKASTTAWTNGDVTITSAISDSESKLAGYAVTTTTATPTNWTSISGSPSSYNVSYKATANGTYYVWAKDAAGNINKNSIKITNIDKTKPSAGTPSGTPTGWTNGNITIKSTISDSDSKLAGYAVTTTTTTPTSWTTVSGSPSSYTLSYAATANNTYYIWVKDIAGNVANSSIKITNIDKTKPTIKNLKINPTGWTSGNVTITATLGDADSKLVGYNVTTTNTTPTGWTAISGNPTSYNLSYSATKNATYYVWAKDNAGNILNSTIAVSKIDKDKPTISVSYTSQVYSNCATTTQNCNTTTTCVEFNDPGCTSVGQVIQETSYANYYCSEGYRNAIYSVINNVDSPYIGNVDLSSIDNVNSCMVNFGASITCSCTKTAVNENCTKVCKAGNVINWSKNPSFTITMSDSLSKLAGYAVTTSTSTPTNWTSISGDKATFSTSHSVSTNGTYYVWTKDNAGNIKNTTVKVVSADSKVPTISDFTIVDAKDKGYNSNKFKLTITASDSDSGVVSYCFSKTNQSSNCTWEDSNTKVITDGTEGSGTKLTYYAFVKDRAGNISSAKTATYTLYKSCTNKIASKDDEVGSCNTACGSGTQSVTHYWKDSYLGTACDNTTESRSCTSSYGCCTGCQCYNNCPPYPYPIPTPEPSADTPTAPDCDWKCMADYNSAAWHECAKGATGCSYYDGDGNFLSDGSRDKMKEANDELYRENAPDVSEMNEHGERLDSEGNCVNCGKN